MTPILFANSIAADAGFIPGLAIFGPAMGLPLSVFAAFIERPFVTRAGFERNAIWFSLQANFVSLLVGYIATLIVIPLLMGPIEVLGLIWPFLAVGISITTERQYLTMRLGHGVVPWAPVATGNIISAVSCIAIMVVAAFMRESVPQLWLLRLRDYELAMNFSVATVSLALLVASFTATKPSGGHRPITEQSVQPELPSTTSH